MQSHLSQFQKNQLEVIARVTPHAMAGHTLRLSGGSGGRLDFYYPTDDLVRLFLRNCVRSPLSSRVEPPAHLNPQPRTLRAWGWSTLAFDAAGVRCRIELPSKCCRHGAPPADALKDSDPRP